MLLRDLANKRNQSVQDVIHTIVRSYLEKRQAWPSARRYINTDEFAALVKDWGKAVRTHDSGDATPRAAGQADAADAEEKRLFRRKKLVLPATVRRIGDDGSAVYTNGYIDDISLGGMRVQVHVQEGDRALEPGDVMEVEFRFAEDDEPMVFKGKACRLEQEGTAHYVGVRLIDGDFEDYQSLAVTLIP
jgi:hypothetical protein